MMAIRDESDLEAQLEASVQRFGMSSTADEWELNARSADWLYERRVEDYRPIQDVRRGTYRPAVEPSRPLPYGRRFIPAWLAAERKRCMGTENPDASGRSIWCERGYIVQDDDPTVMWPWAWWAVDADKST